MLEGKYKTNLIKRIEHRFPGCLVLKNDASYRQGIPDLIFLFHDFWAMLEVKKSANETPRPNQPYYVDMLNRMSFSAFVYPENEEDVLNEIQQAFEYSRSTRRTKR